MRILIGSSSAPDRGAGISTYCKEISEALVSNGHEIYYASPTPDSHEWLKKHNIIHVPTPFSRNMDSLVNNLLSVLFNNDIKGIINNDNAVLQNIAPFSKVPFISVGHLDSTTIGSMLGHNINWVDYTVAISSDMHINLMKKFRLPPYKCPLIYNGIKDINEYPIFVKKNEKLKIIFGGGLIPRKGGDLIKELLIKSQSEHGIHFDIFGELPKRIPPSLLELNHVSFHGRVDRKTYIHAVSDADIFLLPSRAEGCPMALIEAMSFGLLPIVSNGIGAMRWIINNSQNGYVCDLSNWASQCLEVLSFLKNKPDHMKRMRKGARETFVSDYTSQNTITKLLYLLQNPIISREYTPTSAKIIHWHRWPNSTILQRLNYRFGLLNYHSKYSFYK